MPDSMDEEFEEVFDELLHFLDTFEKDAKEYIDAEEQNSTHFGTGSPKDLASFIQAVDDELNEFTKKTLASGASRKPEDESETIDEEGMNTSPDLAALREKTVDELAEALDSLFKPTEEGLSITVPSERSTADAMDDENEAPFDEAFVKNIEDEIRAAEESLMSSNPIEWPIEEDDEDLDPEIDEKAMNDFMEKELSLRQTQAAPDYTAVQQYLIPLFKNFDDAVAALESTADKLGSRNRTQDSAETLILCQNLFNLKKAFLKEPTQENLKVFSEMCDKLIVDAQTNRINSDRGNNPMSWLQSKMGVDTDTMTKVRGVKQALGVIKLSETPVVSDDKAEQTHVSSPKKI